MKPYDVIEHLGHCPECGATKQEQGEPVAWVSFEDREPPIDSAFDDPEVKSVRSVLVTNNICSKDRMGRHSHVWFAAPIKNSKGEWVAYTDSSRKIEYLTHWLDPFTTPQQRKPLTDEVVKLRGEIGVLVGLLGAALQVIDTVDGEDAAECEMLMELQNKITYAIRAAQGIKESA